MEHRTSNTEAVLETLKNDGVIIFPTDTVWGVGCLISSEVAIEKVYQIKNRPSDKPTGIFVRDLEMASRYAHLNQQAKNLAEKYWPGALALVLPAKETVPEKLQAEGQTISIRVPKQTEVLDLLEQAKEALVQTSANFSGQPAAKIKQELDPRFVALADQVILGRAGDRPPSTIVDATTEELKIIRQGDLLLESLTK